MITALIRAELLKLTSTRMVRGMAFATLGIVVLNVALNIVGAGRGELPSLATRTGVDNVFAAAGTGMTLMLVVGVMSMSGEVRHGTATATFLVTPHRPRVILAKVAAGALVGLGFAALAVAVTAAVAFPWISFESATTPSPAGVATILGGSVFLTVAAAVVGTGMGAIIRNQTAAVVIVLGWVLVLEGLLGSLVPAVGRWTISGTTAALVTEVGTGFDSGDLLPWPVAAAVVIAYGALAAGIGARSMSQADL